MRYYELVLNTNAEWIEQNTRIRLKDYDYESVLCAVNKYFHRFIDNPISFLIYREEGASARAVFAYDEKKILFQDAYERILNMLNDAFRVDKVAEEPAEITMYRFCDCIIESKRRGMNPHYTYVVDRAKVLVYDQVMHNLENPFCYDLTEKIILAKKRKVSRMYDESLIRELANIEAHRNVSGFHGNMVHYVISAGSVEAAGDMTEILMQRLAEAGRVSGRRMEIVREMDPELYKRHNRLEEFIENNSGGVVVMDLTEKFGCDPVDYDMNSKYIAKLMKQYRNECLFVFTYNTENPGFAYQLLPMIKEQVILVNLSEGKGDRRAAVDYLKELIADSRYAEYACQAEEFMQLFTEKTFTQSDVLEAFGKFEPWCVNKNFLNAYPYGNSDTFMLDRSKEERSPYEKLQGMIGLACVKEQIDRIIASDVVERERKRRQGKGYQAKSMHMVFCGNPGTAKTTVAKLFAGIAKERGILKSGAFVEKGGMDMCGVKSIRDAFTAAKGGVLFIDEAYSVPDSTSITTLIQEMENRRDDVIVILAGYNESIDQFMKRNEGLKSRVPYRIEFPDYSAEELSAIFMQVIKERGFTVTEAAVQAACEIFERARTLDDFGNGRYVRNLAESSMQKQSTRLAASGRDPESLGNKELFRITKYDICAPEELSVKCRKPGMAKRELDDMIGLEGVKAVIHKATACFKLKKRYRDMGIRKDKPAMHMVFTGNPGTAKTTVARLFAEIMKDEKILASGKFVEVGRADLVGQFVGQTAPLVKRKFKEAKGGVLFIDEAYSLCDGYQGGYGDEAINTIVQEMENHREDVIVIFAGYPKPMKEFLDRNPGMASRIAFRVEFEDYSTEELCGITRLMVAKKEMKITEAALRKLREIYETARKKSDYGNGRFVRKMLEEAEMNLAERLLEQGEKELAKEVLTTIEECDVPQPAPGGEDAQATIGFRVA